MRSWEVSSVHGVSPWRLAVKSTLAGKVAIALHRQRRAPLVAWRSARLARQDGPPARGSRERVRAVMLISVGPGELEVLSDVIDSIEAWEGDGARVVVVDDATPDVRAAAVAARHPRVTVVRSRWPTCGPPRLSPPLALGMRAALALYDFDVLCKLDTDALVTGPGLTERAAAAFAGDPELGALGTVGMRADGVPEDYTYDAWVVGHERRWSRAVRDRVARAEAAGWDGSKVHGGVYLVARRALDAMAAAGDLEVNAPWWSQIGEDTWLSLGVCAAGFRLGSWGAPGEPTASASKWLPVPLAEAVAGRVLAVHSVRRGAAGEDEVTVRGALRAARQARSRAAA